LGEYSPKSSRMLLWFFLCVTLSSIATILTNTGTDWEWAFAPSQDALLILGGVFLVRFAYWYPTNDQPVKARWVVSIYGGLALAALGPIGQPGQGGTGRAGQVQPGRV
jgi:peptidoglycan/LPS O-acetylase OafA/YrhL